MHYAYQNITNNKWMPQNQDCGSNFVLANYGRTHGLISNRDVSHMLLN